MSLLRAKPPRHPLSRRHDKTAGAVCLMSPDEFSRYKKLTNRKGQSSVLRNVLEANGRAL
jgi:hypothetical protein